MALQALFDEQQMAEDIVKLTDAHTNIQKPSRSHQDKQGEIYLDMIVKVPNTRQREFLKAARQITFEWTTVRLGPSFTASTVEARQHQNDIINGLKENNYDPKFLYSAKISLKNMGKIKIFSDNLTLTGCYQYAVIKGNSKGYISGKRKIIPNAEKTKTNKQKKKKKPEVP